MQQKQRVLPIFFVFLVASFFIFFLSSHHLLPGENIAQNGIFSLQSGFFSVLSIPSRLFQSDTVAKLKEENLSLRSQLSKMHQLQEDNTALRDQFQTTTIPSQQLLPAEVIGDPQFIPHVSAPESLVIHVGAKNGVQKGDVAVYKDNVIGIITSVADYTALITVVSNTSLSFTAKTTKTNAQGVLTGQGNGEMILGNVLLSDTLTVGDTVVTSGSENTAGHGFPPGLVVGKIISVSKNPSNLYQSASVESLLPIEKLPMVFILK